MKHAQTGDGDNLCLSRSGVSDQEPTKPQWDRGLSAMERRCFEIEPTETTVEDGLSKSSTCQSSPAPQPPSWTTGASHPSRLSRAALTAEMASSMACGYQEATLGCPTMYIHTIAQHKLSLPAALRPANPNTTPVFLPERIPRSDPSIDNRITGHWQSRTPSSLVIGCLGEPCSQAAEFF